ncbi:MAG TPA: amidohydrolase family protein [Micromonosporaceae bacterium]|nr:amidohydrolase family protein [Micromonosporaceae bacterium]
MKTLDLHTHHYTPEFFDAVRRSGGDYSFAKDPTGRDIITLRGARFFGVTPAMTDLSARLDAMDAAGIDVAVLSLSTPNLFFLGPRDQPELARRMNDAYAQVAADHPSRIKAFASIPMDAPDAALAELHRALGELRLNGVILLSNIGGRPVTDPAYRPFFAEADRLGLCIFLHPMIPASGQEALREYVLGPIVAFPFDTTLAVARMCYAGMFREYANIRWIVAHAGGAIPWLMERIDSGYRDFAENREHIDELPSVYLKRLYYDTVTFSPHNLTMLRDLVGTDHMVLGSDFPHLLGAIDRAVPSIRALPIPVAEQDRILGGTALSILNNG